MRGKKAMINFGMSILLQLIVAASGLVIPRLFIEYYGSEVNGLIVSLNQFLSYITFFEAGLSGVVMSQLYGPIANDDNALINQILANARAFFYRIAGVYIVYVVALAFAYPRIVTSEFSNTYVLLLILILSIGLLFQYLFGIVNSIYLQADQKSYIVSGIQIVVVILNAAIVIGGIKIHMGIHQLKLLAIFATIINPVALYLYVRKKNKIDFKIKGSSNKIKQRWDGIFHHISYFVQNNIDIMILTFLDLRLVSVYSVYRMIMFMVRKFFESFIISFKSAMGDLLARKEYNQLSQIFSLLEFLVYSLSSIVFISLGFSILPFIELYINNITTVNYLLPVFAILIILAEAFYIIRIPYHTVIIASGHFKQTKWSALTEATLNTVISITMVSKFGIIGVAIGTCISCLYRTLYYIYYLKKNILHLSYVKEIKRIITNISCVVVCIFIFRYINLVSTNYFQWFLNGLIYVLISSVIVVTTNILIFKEDGNIFIQKLKTVIKK